MADTRAVTIGVGWHRHCGYRSTVEDTRRAASFFMDSVGADLFARCEHVLSDVSFMCPSILNIPHRAQSWDALRMETNRLPSSRQCVPRATTINTARISQTHTLPTSSTHWTAIWLQAPPLHTDVTSKATRGKREASPPAGVQALCPPLYPPLST